MYSNHSRYLFLAGFLTVMVLMSGLILVGYQEMSDINHRMEQIVNKHNVKTNYITTMYNAARERAVLILRMLDMEDPFDRDELILRFNELATEFAVARISMRELGLNDTEIRYSQEQHKLTLEAMPFLDNVIELLHQDEIEPATRVMLDKALPAQDKVLAQLSNMMDYQYELAKKELYDASTSYEKARIQIALLAFGAFAISFMIAIIIMKYAARAREALFSQVTLQSIGDAVITTNEKGIINYLNPLAEKMTGWRFEEANGKHVTDIFNVTGSHDGISIREMFEHAVKKLEPLDMHNDAHIESTSSRSIAIDFTVNPIYEKADRAIGNVIAFRNVSKERKLKKQLSYQACHDALTGLINRHEFEKRLESTINLSKQDHTSHALFYLDLDEFKVVNDTCGHIAGDELLRQIAMLLKDHLRQHDTVARLGGDEFGVILEDCNIPQAVHLASKILLAIQETQFAWEDKSFNIGASIGVVEIDQYSKDINHVLGIADAACYSAKDSGRNRVHVAEKDDKDIAMRQGEMRWVSIITHALEHNQFVLYCQKIEALHKNDPGYNAFEVLLRMKDGHGDVISPSAFIPAAERYNLMRQIDHWVVDQTLNWLAINRRIENIDKCSINISGRSLGDDEFLKHTKRLINILDLDPGKICFEITETAAITNLSNAINFMSELKRLGCCFSLDDFGSGLSSFAYLKTLPVDYVKIDGMFVRDIADDAIDREMVQAIVSIAKAMGKQVIAEYVENSKIKALLKEMDVDFIQGYYVEKPRSMTDLELASTA